MTPTQPAILAGSHALALQALEGFLRHLRFLHRGNFLRAADQLRFVEMRAEQCLILDQLWRESMRRRAS